METATLRPWQTRLDEKTNETPDPRKIMWYWETTGNVGKTWMAKYLMATKGAAILQTGKYADLTYMLKDHTGSAVVFNLTRTVEEDKINHLYGLCEAIKDDIVISTKYECHMVPLGRQHVIVFANQPPDYDKWSEDRYDVHEITPEDPPLKRAPIKSGFQPGFNPGQASRAVKSREDGNTIGRRVNGVACDIETGEPWDM
jgi:hypothetical protein